MQQMKKRLDYLFGSTKGLILVAVAMISMVSGLFGMLSGPMAEAGFSKVVVRGLGMNLIPAEREGRIVILYHTIANAVIEAESEAQYQYHCHHWLSVCNDLWPWFCLLGTQLGFPWPVYLWRVDDVPGWCDAGNCTVAVEPGVLYYR